MIESQELYDSLILLSQKIIESKENNPIMIVRELLLDIDNNNFLPLFDLWG